MSGEMLTIILAVIGLPAALYGLYQLYLDFPGIFENWIPGRGETRGKGFRVRSTTLKALIGEEETEVIKLRKVRMYKTQRLLDAFDIVPEVYDPAHPNDARPARTRGLYSIPGTAQETQDGILVRISEDEEPFLPLRDHNVVVGYMLTEKIDDLFKPEPPQLTARAPVGWERLVIEVHLPPDLQFKRDPISGATKAKVFTQRQNEQQIPAKIKRHIHDFNDGLGPVEWVRAVVQRPPNRGEQDIVFEWEWEQKTPAAHAPPPALTKASDAKDHTLANN